ncbi:hypothetical protein EB001_03165 [bacterium]|nr:hypothetical protein [bacterium]
MTLVEKQQQEYLKEMEQVVNPAIVERFKDWPTESKLYMYLHHFQIDMMGKFTELLSKEVSKS